MSDTEDLKSSERKLVQVRILLPALDCFMENNKNKEEDEWLTIHEAAALTKVDVRTIYNWIKDNKVETCEVPSGRIRVKKYSLFKPRDYKRKQKRWE